MLLQVGIYIPICVTAAALSGILQFPVFVLRGIIYFLFFWTIAPVVVYAGLTIYYLRKLEVLVRQLNTSASDRIHKKNIIFAVVDALWIIEVILIIIFVLSPYGQLPWANLVWATCLSFHEFLIACAQFALLDSFSSKFILKLFVGEKNSDNSS